MIDCWLILIFLVSTIIQGLWSNSPYQDVWQNFSCEPQKSYMLKCTDDDDDLFDDKVEGTKVGLIIKTMLGWSTFQLTLLLSNTMPNVYYGTYALKIASFNLGLIKGHKWWSWHALCIPWPLPLPQFHPDLFHCLKEGASEEAQTVIGNSSYLFIDTVSTWLFATKVLTFS